MMFMRKKLEMPTKETALKGRASPIPTAKDHYVLKRALKGPYPAGIETAVFGMGCFWGAERMFWKLGAKDGGDGIWITAVGYAAGITPNPTYDEVCSGGTGHNEVVLVAFDPAKVTYEQLLKVFWENHNPTQGMRQGNDTGTQYRSGIYVFGQAQRDAAEASLKMFAPVLAAGGYGAITTEIVDAAPFGDRYETAAGVEPSPTVAVFFPAEAYHQQYLSKNPNGYCGLGGTGMSCPIGIASQA
jgi:peptide-methionine (S)-S-oxide reductase